MTSININYLNIIDINNVNIFFNINLIGNKVTELFSQKKCHFE